MRTLPLLFTLALAAPAWLAPQASRAQAALPAEVPPAPRYYVLDEPRVIPAKPLKALETLVIEHDRLTGEQFMIAVVSGTRGESLRAYSQRVFEKWRVGMRGEDTGILLLLDWSSRKAIVHTGLGLESALPESKSQQLLDDFLIPEARAGDAARGLSLVSVEILRTLDSPLVQSGKARQIVRAGGFTGPWRALGDGSSGALWFLLVLICLAPPLAALYQITAAEAHFTSAGWFRPNPWAELRWHLRNAMKRLGKARAQGFARGEGGENGASAQW